jgi:cytochrome P450
MSTAVSAFPRSDADFTDPAFVLDPYPVYEEIRAIGPVVLHEPTGQYLVTGWRDCARVLGNAASFGSIVSRTVDRFGAETIECMEKDRHDVAKSIWAEAFTRSTLEAHRALIREVVDSRLLPFVERLRSGERVDAVADLIRSIPTLVIARLMDIPAEDHQQFALWTDTMSGITAGKIDTSSRGPELVRAGMQATAELNRYVHEQIEERRTRPGDDLISLMVTSPLVHELTEDEVVAGNTQLVFAGNGTSAKWMSQVIAALSTHPDTRRMLVEDPSLIPQAIEEVHRWNTMAQVNWRYVRNGGAVVADRTLRDDDVVLCLMGAANRDPDRWEHPDRLDIVRKPQQHLGFGFGLHSCLGLNLARLEVQIWLERLLEELPEWEVTDIDSDIDWGTEWTLRGPVRIDVTAA